MVTLILTAGTGIFEVHAEADTPEDLPVSFRFLLPNGSTHQV